MSMINVMLFFVFNNVWLKQTLLQNSKYHPLTYCNLGVSLRAGLSAKSFAIGLSVYTEKI
jgi:hypothetical protein